MIYSSEDIKKWDCSAEINGKWVLARPIQLGWKDRVRTAWEVLCGRCDGLKWFGQ